MPTREEAIETLYDLINSGILSEELEEKLEDIVKCIQAEDDKGIFIWGAKDNDWVNLYIALRSDLWTPEKIEEIKKIYEKYRIKEKDGE